MTSLGNAGDNSHILSSRIGRYTRIWQYCVILEGAIIGSECNICSHVYIENDVRIGNRVTIKNASLIYDGVRIDDDVFIGPRVVFANDKYPRSKHHLESYDITRVERFASIGAGSIILPGLCIGEGSIIGAGSIVTKSVSPNSVVAGNPAVHLRSI